MEALATQAVLLRSINYGEADRICHLLTREFGRISALARSARRSRKRFGGALSLFVLGEAIVARPRSGDMFHLQRFDYIEDFSIRLSQDLVAMAHGSYLLELTALLLPEGQAEPLAFDLLSRALRALAAAGPSPSLLRAFELQLLGAAGVGPALAHCTQCGQSLPEGAVVAFSPERGGAVCFGCWPGGPTLDPVARQALSRLSLHPIHPGPPEPLSSEISRKIRTIMLDWIQRNYGKIPKSVEFLMQLKSRPTG